MPCVQQRLHLRKAHQRPGSQLWKERQILQRPPEAARAALRRAGNIHNIADCLKRVKRDAERQRAAPFICSQHRKIDGHAGSKQQSASAPGTHERKSHAVVQRTGCKQQRKMTQIAEGIKHQPRRDQQHIFFPYGPQQVVRDQHKRQECEQKNWGSEVHKRFSCEKVPPQSGGTGCYGK